MFDSTPILVRIATVSLLALSGCNALLPPALLPDPGRKNEVPTVASYSVDYISFFGTRGNMLSTIEGRRIEINPSIMEWRDQFAPTDRYLWNHDNRSPALWLGLEGLSHTVLGQESTLILIIDGHRFASPSGYESVMGDLLDSRQRLRALGAYTNIDEVSRKEGEFGLYLFDHEIVDLVQSVTMFEFEMQGPKGSFFGVVEGAPLELIQRYWSYNFARTGGLLGHRSRKASIK